MGDNRADSDDSRYRIGDPGGGTIPESAVVGRAFVIIWPLSRISDLPIPNTFQQAGPARGGRAGDRAARRRRRRRRRPVRRRALLASPSAQPKLSPPVGRVRPGSMRPQLGGPDGSGDTLTVMSDDDAAWRSGTVAEQEERG